MEQRKNPGEYVALKAMWKKHFEEVGVINYTNITDRAGKIKNFPLSLKP